MYICSVYLFESKRVYCACIYIILMWVSVWACILDCRLFRTNHNKKILQTPRTAAIYKYNTSKLMTNSIICRIYIWNYFKQSCSVCVCVIFLLLFINFNLVSFRITSFSMCVDVEEWMFTKIIIIVRTLRSLVVLICIFLSSVICIQTRTSTSKILHTILNSQSIRSFVCLCFAFLWQIK